MEVRTALNREHFSDMYISGFNLVSCGISNV